MSWSDDERRQFRSLLLADPDRFEAFHRSPLFGALVQAAEPLLDLVAAECLAYEEQAYRALASTPPREVPSIDWSGLLGQVFGGYEWVPLSDLGRRHLAETRRARDLGRAPLVRGPLS